MVNLSVNLGGLKMKVPVTTCSGTFAAGLEYSDFLDLSALGAVTTKGVSLNEWRGNKAPRIAECSAGLLNSIGLQNPGVEAFCETSLGWLAQQNVPIIANVSGHSIEEYCHVIERLEKENSVGAYEINISCPNVSEGGMAFGTDPQKAAEVTSACRNVTKRPLIVKLTPNVTDISLIAKAVEDAGADALSLINTVLGMAIDIDARKPKLDNIFGGLSGPAIKPIALRAVWQVYDAVQIPILGMGGIMNVKDALEFMMAGAQAIAIGSANFVNPKTCIEVIDGISHFCDEQNLSDINEIVGVAHDNCIF